MQCWLRRARCAKPGAAGAARRPPPGARDRLHVNERDAGPQCSLGSSPRQEHLQPATRSPEARAQRQAAPPPDGLARPALPPRQAAAQITVNELNTCGKLNPRCLYWRRGRRRPGGTGVSHAAALAGHLAGRLWRHRGPHARLPGPGCQGCARGTTRAGAGARTSRQPLAAAAPAAAARLRPARGLPERRHHVCGGGAGGVPLDGGGGARAAGARRAQRGLGARPHLW